MGKNIIKKLRKDRIILFINVLLSLGIFIFAILVFLILRLPSIETLKNVQWQEPLRIYSNDNQLIAEFGDKKRTPISIDKVSNHFITAVLDTEDRRFYSHYGVDITGLFRAAWFLISKGAKVQGGSTITMQVARNFFLTRKKTFIRKLNEILLSLKIEKTLTKKQILELYLNKIYFGNRAYGIEAASQIYYGKHASELNLLESAMLAGLPKAPSSLNPLASSRAALDRRKHVLSRMLYYGDIDQVTYDNLISQPLSAKFHGSKITVQAPYIAEMVREKLISKYGNNAYYSGLKVFTTLNSKLQHMAKSAVVKSVMEYERRHGYEGILYNWQNRLATNDLTEIQNNLQKINHVSFVHSAIVMNIMDNDAYMMLDDGTNITVSWPQIKWAAKRQGIDHVNNKEKLLFPRKISDVMTIGDVVYTYFDWQEKTWYLANNPKVNGSFVAMNPHNGSILALVGGIDYKQSNFNSAIQANRLIGSSIKPFIYSAALAKGYTAASIINDAPIIVKDPSAEDLWRPVNHNHKFYGPTRLREALIHSRNLVSIRLLRALGIKYVRQYLTKFGFSLSNLPNSLSLALGTTEFSPVKLSVAYSVFANGGFLVKQNMINKIFDRDNNIIWQNKPLESCYQCVLDRNNVDKLQESNANKIIELNNEVIAPQVITPQNAYIISDMLQDAIKFGTGRKALILHRNDIGGKTGTTNKFLDDWYIGFNTQLVATAWLGYNNPTNLHEYAAKAALPMWIYFMQKALPDIVETKLTAPNDIVHVRINSVTGKIANENDNKAIFEIFRKKNIATTSKLSKNVDDAADSSNTISSESNKTIQEEDIF